ncbi:hypothetical protein HPB47_001690 [Ixodes persulcatus]|uniref:Uncharacterized protein n=1 Tax=Ixodes persulcatus TaxID=34615 RepID=A0AC60PNB9_IXOPE|nr:hypothetical protein HPB47_001690 [Ixodes persulcatus]
MRSRVRGWLFGADELGLPIPTLESLRRGWVTSRRRPILPGRWGRSPSYCGVSQSRLLGCCYAGRSLRLECPLDLLADNFGDRQRSRLVVSRQELPEFFSDDVADDFPKAVDTGGAQIQTAVVTVLIAMFSALPLLMMIIGIQYLQECPKEPNIPLYLLIGGAFGLIKVGTLLYHQMRRLRYERLDDGLADGDMDEVWSSTSTKITEYALTIFLLIWFGMGNYWVLRIYKPRFQPLLHEPNNYCDKTVYTFAVAHLLVCYGVIALLVAEVICLALCVRVLGVWCKK